MALLMWLIIAGCTAASQGSAEERSSSVPSAAAALDCTGGEMRTPSGAVIDLTGTWSGGSTTFYLRQLDHCVWWIGLSAYPDQTPGACFSNTFFGRVEGADQLRGTWASIIVGGGECSGTTQGGRSEGPLTLQLDYACGGCAGMPTLRDPWNLKNTTPSPYFYAPELRWVGQLPAPEPLR